MWIFLRYTILCQYSKMVSIKVMGFLTRNPLFININKYLAITVPIANFIPLLTERNCSAYLWVWTTYWNAVWWNGSGINISPQNVSLYWKYYIFLAVNFFEWTFTEQLQWNISSLVVWWFCSFILPVWNKTLQ